MVYENAEVNDVLTTLNGYLSKLMPAIKDCASHYQSGQLSEGLNLLINIIEGLDWVIKIAATNIEMQENHMRETNLKLNEIVKALENEDYVLVGDLLEYEILPAMQEILDKTALLIPKSTC